MYQPVVGVVNGLESRNVSVANSGHKLSRFLHTVRFVPSSKRPSKGLTKLNARLGPADVRISS